jgi:hypothetical protein
MPATMRCANPKNIRRKSFRPSRVLAAASSLNPAGCTAGSLSADGSPHRQRMGP